LAKSTKVSKTGAKFEAVIAAGKAKKPPTANSTVDAGAKPTKSGKKAPVLANAKAKANATVVSKEESTAELEVKEDMVLTKQAEEGTDDLISEFRDCRCFGSDRAPRVAPRGAFWSRTVLPIVARWFMPDAQETVDNFVQVWAALRRVIPYVLVRILCVVGYKGGPLVSGMLEN
jgi:hypothetical protein